MKSDRADIQGDELPPGSVLCGGQYTIDQYLNAGGFGVTYLARDSLGRRVVIKECFPSAVCFRTERTVRVRSQGSTVEFDTILELFEREARALAGLQHPYIVGVHQYFRDNETAYMAMDFIEGRTLLDIIQNDPDRLTSDVVKNLLQQLLQAVSFIHRNDILHRDISPDNILIDDDNLPVLIDFGAAREDATRVSRALSKVLTVKDGYSPQEFYLAGSDQVYASDLYALAATFHHVVTGAAPASSHSRMAAEVRKQPDPLKPLGSTPGYDTAFLSAINTCLSLFPTDRLPTADAWQEAINEELRRKKLMLMAKMDRNIDLRVANLVKAFFKDFSPVVPGAKPAPKVSPENEQSQSPSTTAEFAAASALTPDLELEDLRPDRTFAQARVLRATPSRIESVEPSLQPIDRIRLKFAKKHEPDPETAPTEKSSILPGLQGFLKRIALTETKHSDGDDQSKERV